MELSKPGSLFRGCWQRPELRIRFQGAEPAPLQKDLFTLRPAQDPARQRRFAVIGDAGDGSPAQHAIGRQMERLYRQTPFASVLVLGDNVYEHGEPHLFRERIYEPYRPLFEQGVRFFPVLGNHDAKRGFGEQQLQYWGAPRFYSVPIGPPGKPEAELFAIDTTVLLPGRMGCYRDNPFWARQKADEQMQWLDKALRNSKARYKIVYGHYPLYSSGTNSVRPQNESSINRLRAILEPVLARHGVNLYLAGHDHHYERTAPIQGVRHMVSGGGGAEIRPTARAEGLSYPREKAVSRHHFMLFELTDAGLKYEVHAPTGEVLDTGLIRERLTQLRFA